MAHGTTYSAIKSLLVARLGVRSGLAGVSILYQPPLNPLDVNSFGGSREAIWFGDAVGEFANVVFCGPELRFDESITVTLAIQVLGKDSESSQERTDQRVEELLLEVLSELASNAFRVAVEQTDTILSAFDYILVTPSTQEWHAGRLGPDKTYAAGMDIGILVESRRSYP